ncbi:ATP-dependent RNA helicase glh-2-like [Panicum miliaceum]|uniref:ATP-dependent RNA helicase glh-2-like n=1 Tax=Panicum miliaceum TaxID=4540 RepID=A0A3L6TFZ9_PANMI|nr:ATP-dependent RNA helicase glh-2-like [Panicum miliaceum]
MAQNRADDSRGADASTRTIKRRVDERGDSKLLGEEDLRHKLIRDQDKGYGRPAQMNFQRRDDRGVEFGRTEGQPLCYRCNQTGHLHSDCTNPPIYYNCKESGHMSSSCPQIKVNKGLKLCGFGLPGQMFYSIQIPVEEEDQDQKPILAVMHIREGITWVVEEESAKKDKGGDIFVGVDKDEEDDKEEKSDCYTPFLEEFANPNGKSAGDGGLTALNQIHKTRRMSLSANIRETT